jgi:ferric-dicitrate binding protein FerR (iron transport regulator)
VSVRHDQAFREIRREYDDVVTALKFAERNHTNLNLGRPEFDSTRLGAAIATAGDAYALLLVARAEAFMRDYLGSLGTSLGSEPKLSTLIDKSYRELNLRSKGLRIRANEKIEMHNLRVSRNEYAHGHGRSVFPSIPRVETVLSKFFWLFP